MTLDTSSFALYEMAVGAVAISSDLLSSLVTGPCVLSFNEFLTLYEKASVHVVSKKNYSHTILDWWLRTSLEEVRGMIIFVILKFFQGKT